MSCGLLAPAAWNPFFDGKAALARKMQVSVATSQEVVEDLLERTRKVCGWGGGCGGWAVQEGAEGGGLCCVVGLTAISSTQFNAYSQLLNTVLHRMCCVVVAAMHTRKLTPLLSPFLCALQGEIGGSNSVLSAMLNEVSPSTGDYVRINNIYGQVMNLMIAGKPPLLGQGQGVC